MVGKGLSKWVIMMALIVLLCPFGAQVLHASQAIFPSSAPPTGKVWIKGESGWKLEPMPPADAPYAWVKDHWKKIEDIPSGKEWVPAYWGKNGWVPAHWCPVVYPYSEAKWIPGLWDSDGRWIQGHWEMAPNSDSSSNFHGIWVPGHRKPRGRWVHGYWR